MTSTEQSNKSSEPTSLPPPPPVDTSSGTGCFSLPKLLVRTKEMTLLDDESPQNFSFDNDLVRRGFVRKVYSILMCQLLMTAAFIAVFVFSEQAKGFVFENPQLIYVSIIVSFVTVCAISCCEKPRRSYPMNFIFLFIFTLAESFLLGVISSVYQANEVLLAVGLCAVVCFSLTIFAFQTKIDFTPLGGVLFVCLTVLLMFLIVTLLWRENDTLRLVYAAVGVIIFSVYLIYDTQLLMDGKHRKYTISPEEYIFAALTLYLDIINLFLFILRLIRLR